MPSADLKRKAMAIAIFVLPIIAVQIAPFVLVDVSPQSASADPADTPPTPVKKGPAEFKPTDKQLRATKYIAGLNGGQFGPNPLLYIAAPVIPDPIPVVVEPDPVEPPPPPPPPKEFKFTLHAVLSGESGRKALIDGRSYREGDLIRDTPWMVVSINPNDRSVDLEDMETHKTMVIRVDLPEIFR